MMIFVPMQEDLLINRNSDAKKSRICSHSPGRTSSSSTKRKQCLLSFLIRLLHYDTNYKFDISGLLLVIIFLLFTTDSVSTFTSGYIYLFIYFSYILEIHEKLKTYWIQNKSINKNNTYSNNRLEEILTTIVLSLTVITFSLKLP